MEEYVLEYNEKQDAFHIHTVSSREKVSDEINIDWKILETGTYDYLTAKMNILLNQKAV